MQISFTRNDLSSIHASSYDDGVLQPLVIVLCLSPLFFVFRFLLKSKQKIKRATSEFSSHEPDSVPKTVKLFVGARETNSLLLLLTELQKH